MINFLDTSAVLNGAYNLFENIYISPLVISELENIKTSSSDEKKKYCAREAVRVILNSTSILNAPVPQYKVKWLLKKYNFLSNINDHKLICEASILAKNQPVRFITSDGAQYLFAQWIPNLQTFLFSPEQEVKEKSDFCGWSRYFPTEAQLTSLYTSPNINILEAKTNEFCEIYVENELKDVLFWNGTSYRPLKYKEFTSVLGEKIRPRNLEQKMYLDLLQNKSVPIKLCVAKFGTGKSMLALAYALNELSQGRYDKIIFVKNNLEVKGAGKLGTLPGDSTAKQMPWLQQIADHIGQIQFEDYLANGQIEPAHLSSLRGRDLKNCIILVDEAENLLASNIQLLLGRVAENSEIIFCADIKQCDYREISMSGIPKMIERLAGHPLFGMVKLLKTERSAIAAMADLMD